MPARRLSLLGAAILTSVAVHDVAGLQGPCAAPPGAPTSLTIAASGTTVSVSWAAPTSGCPAHSYVIEAGSQRGLSDLPPQLSYGARTSLLLHDIMEAVYYVRVRAINPAGASEPSNEVRIVVGHGEPDVIVARRTPGRNTYFPAVERLANGDLIVVFYDSPQHVSPDGRIAVVKSVDGGRTWSMPRVAIDTPLDDRDPSVMLTSKGALLLSYFSADYQSGVSSGVFVVRSEDQGATWSAPAKVATTLATAATTARIVELENGELLIPIYGLANGRARSAIVRSSDDGRSWPENQHVVIGSSAAVGLMEPALVNLGAGHLMTMMRTEGSDDLAMSSESSNGGRTWSEPVKTGVAAQGSDLLAVPDNPDRPRSAVHAWSDWSRQFGPSRPTVMQLIEFGEPSAAPSYGPLRMVYNSRCDDAAYPSSVMLTNERLFVVYYDACAGHIGGSFMTLGDLQR